MCVLRARLNRLFLFLLGVGQVPPGSSLNDYTVGRGPVPRHVPVLAANVRGLWVSGVFRLGRQIAGDRPPHYGKKDDFPCQEVPNLGNLGNEVLARFCSLLSPHR